eukprot:gene12068-14120_t
MNVTNPVCTAYQKAGQFCDQKTYRCPDTMQCVYNTAGNKTCENVYYASAGEVCFLDRDCSQENNTIPVMQCIKGVCVLKTGDVCSAIYGCGYGQYCKNPSTDDAVCVPTVGLGAICNHTSILNQHCHTNLICSPAADGKSNTCIEPFTKTVNQPCAGTALLYGIANIPITDCKVSDGLQCINSVCKKITPTPSSVNCTVSTCGSTVNELCVCDSFNSGTGACQLALNLDQDCQDSLQDIIDCATEHKCKDDISAPGSESSFVAVKPTFDTCAYVDKYGQLGARLHIADRIKLTN